MKPFLPLTVLILMLSLTLSGQESFTLDQAKQYALKNSLNLKNKQLDLRDVNGQLKEYTAIGLPKLQASATYNYFLKIPTNIFPDFIEPAIYDVLFDENLLPRRDLPAPGGVPVQFGTKHNFSAGLELNTLLFDGVFFLGLKAQRMYRELILKQITLEESSVKHDVSLAYLSALVLEENIQIVTRNLENLRKVQQEVTEIHRAGFLEKLDVERLELSVSNLEAELQNLQKLTDVSKNVLKFKMQYPLEKEIVLSDRLASLVNSTYLEVMDPAMGLNLEVRPEFPVLQQSLRLAEINIKRYQMSYYPSLYGFATYQQSLQRNKLFDSNDNGWFPSSNVGVQLSWPLFTGFDRTAKIERARVTLERTKVQFTSFEQGAQLEFTNARTSYVNAMVTLENRKKLVGLAEKIYETAKIKFREGVGSSLEVTSAERDLYLSQANLVESQFQLVQAKVNLEKSLGKI